MNKAKIVHFIIDLGGLSILWFSFWTVKDTGLVALPMGFAALIATFIVLRKLNNLYEKI